GLMFSGSVRKRPVGKQKLQRLFAVARHMNIIGQVFSAQGVQSKLDIVPTIFHQQNINGAVGHELPPAIVAIVRSCSLRAPARVKWKVVPLSNSDSAQILAPCLWRMRWTVASPTPVPSKSSARCRRLNTPNNLSAYFMLKPTP